MYFTSCYLKTLNNCPQKKITENEFYLQLILNYFKLFLSLPSEEVRSVAPTLSLSSPNMHAIPVWLSINLVYPCVTPHITYHEINKSLTYRLSRREPNGKMDSGLTHVYTSSREVIFLWLTI